MFDRIPTFKKKRIQLIKANSILGLKPTGVEHMADVLLELGLNDFISMNNPLITIKTFNNFYSLQRSSTGILNEELLRYFSLNLKETLLPIITDSNFPVVLGGDCSILLGIMSALKVVGNYGLITLDAHADFYFPEQSITGEAADMDIALVTGNGSEMLTNIDGLKPYVNEENVMHIGQRDEGETVLYGSSQISETKIHTYCLEKIQKMGFKNAIDNILSDLNNFKSKKFWLHFDTDVIQDDENPAVDYRLPDGLSFKECKEMMGALVKSEMIMGMSFSIYNPALDTNKTVGKKLVTLINHLLNVVL